MSTIHGEHSQAKEWSGSWSGRGTLTQLVEELDRQKESKLDFVVDSRQLEVVVDNGVLCLAGADAQAREWLMDPTPINKNALPQLALRVQPNIPTKYVRDLAAEQPDECARHLTAMLHATGKRRLVRCLDGCVRAFLSDRYRVLDNYDLAFAALDAARDHQGEVIECALSDTHMRLKMTSRALFDAVETRRQEGGGWFSGGLGSQKYLSKVAARTEGELPGGPGTVYPLQTISNSETGHGGLGVRTGLLAAICFNIATVEDVLTRVHLGERLDPGVFSEETLSIDSKAIYAKAMDSVRAAFNPVAFKALVDRCKNANDVEVLAPMAAMNNVVEKLDLNEEHKDAILAHFVRDYDATAYGMAQAIARYAQDIDDPDDAASMEEAAGTVLNKPQMVAVTA